MLIKQKFMGKVFLACAVVLGSKSTIANA